MPSPFTPSTIPASNPASGPFAASIPGTGSVGGTALVGFPAPSTISHASPAVGAYGLLSTVSALSSVAWPTASLAILVPFSVPVAGTVYSAIWTNGAAVSGNVDAGVYNEDGTLLASVGGVAQAGINVNQQAAFTAPTAIPSGSYFFALVLDNITGTIDRYSPGVNVLIAEGVRQAAAAYPLPASVALAAPVNALLPAGWAVGMVSVL